MNRLKEFVKSTVLGGLLVILPLAIFFFAFTWVFGLVQSAISPLTTIIMQKSPLQGIVVDILVVALLIIVCFTVGAIVRTKLGKWLYLFVESNVFLRVPGYSLIKETVFQFL